MRNSGQWSVDSCQLRTCQRRPQYPSESVFPALSVLCGRIGLPPLYNDRVIAHLRGRLISKHPNQAIVEAGGVGYDVIITVPTFSDCRQPAPKSRCTSTRTCAKTRWRSTDFCVAEEKQLFEKLITVSGIGPKLAITILSGMATADMVGAIRGNDFARLTKIPGIGRKTAERMCVELRDKLEGFGAAQAGGGALGRWRRM